MRLDISHPYLDGVEGEFCQFSTHSTEGKLVVRLKQVGDDTPDAYYLILRIGKQRVDLLLWQQKLLAQGVNLSVFTVDDKVIKILA